MVSRKAAICQVNPKAEVRVHKYRKAQPYQRLWAAGHCWIWDKEFAVST